jgi:hypothetical protein
MDELESLFDRFAKSDRVWSGLQSNWLDSKPNEIKIEIFKRNEYYQYGYLYWIGFSLNWRVND